jgi:hypothetical protein
VTLSFLAPEVRSTKRKMEINSKEDLAKAVEEAGTLLQEIQNYLQANDLNWNECQEAKVRFPRGFIRQAGLQRKRLEFLENRTLKDNLAYTLILSDVVLWLKIRTDLWGTPKEMLTKLYVFLIGTLLESITKEYLEGICGKNFKKRNAFLVELNVIDEQLQMDLDWLWDTRNRMHLFQLDAREYVNDYDENCHDRCVKTFRRLLAALRSKGPLKAG